jgi:hypothetical protein
MTTFGRNLPDPEILAVWWTTLEQYPMDAVASALAQHIAESRFAPVPADVVQRMPKLADQRPGVEEAWATAVRAMDESATVMLNNEIVDAWAVAKPVFDCGDEIGARMAFREVYSRLLLVARTNGKPVVWWPSLGTDQDQRYTALQKAVHDGLLPSNAPVVVGALPKPQGDLALLKAPTNSVDAKTAINGLRNFLNGQKDAEEARKDAEHMRMLEQHRATEARKAELRGQAEMLGLSDEGYEEMRLA